MNKTTLHSTFLFFSTHAVNSKVIHNIRTGTGLAYELVRLTAAAKREYMTKANAWAPMQM